MGTIVNREDKIEEERAEKKLEEQKRRDEKQKAEERRRKDHETNQQWEAKLQWEYEARRKVEGKMKALESIYTKLVPAVQNREVTTASGKRKFRPCELCTWTVEGFQKILK